MSSRGRWPQVLFGRRCFAVGLIFVLAAGAFQPQVLLAASAFCWPHFLSGRRCFLSVICRRCFFGRRALFLWPQVLFWPQAFFLLWLQVRSPQVFFWSQVLSLAAGAPGRTAVMFGSMAMISNI